MADIIQKLLAGSSQFRKKFFAESHTSFQELVSGGQKPKVMAITCSDSRVDPALVFNCEPGELFLIRNVANLVPPCENSDTYHGTSAALEFGAYFLEVEHIIILGHTRCGGIQTLLKSTDEIFDKKSHGFIAKWMEIARPAYEKVMSQHSSALFEERVTLCEQYALEQSLNNLQTFSWITDRVKAGKLTLHAWYFDLETGRIHQYDAAAQKWIFNR